MRELSSHVTDIVSDWGGAGMVELQIVCDISGASPDGARHSHDPQGRLAAPQRATRRRGLERR
ncbi:hypothetical protein [Arthrobacter ramosus]